MIRKLLVNATVLASLAVPFALQAEESGGVRYDQKQVSVSLDNVSVKQPAGAKTLLATISSAAREACSRNEGGNRLSALADYNRCVTEAESAAIRAVNDKLDVDLVSIASRGSSRNIAQN